MKKIFLFFIFFIFISNLASAGTLSISPTQINFIGHTNEIICNKITLKSDSPRNLIGEDRWAKRGEWRRKFLLHNLTSDKLGLKLTYNKIISSAKFIQPEICLKGASPGEYHGLLLYKINNNPTGVGIWMNVSLTKRNSLTKITGNVLKNVRKNSDMKFALFISLGLLILFFFLVLKLKSNSKRKTEF